MRKILFLINYKYEELKVDPKEVSFKIYLVNKEAEGRFSIFYCNQ